MDSLKELGLEEKTIVVYTSDNGRGPGRNKTQPLIGGKISTWECGIRVPAILRAPGQKVLDDHICSAIVNAMDWLPTLAWLLRIPLSAFPSFSSLLEFDCSHQRRKQIHGVVLITAFPCCLTLPT